MKNKTQNVDRTPYDEKENVDSERYEKVFHMLWVLVSIFSGFSHVCVGARWDFLCGCSDFR